MHDPKTIAKMLYDQLAQDIETNKDALLGVTSVHPPVVNTFTIIVDGQVFLINVKKVSK